MVEICGISLRKEHRFERTRQGGRLPFEFLSKRYTTGDGVRGMWNPRPAQYHPREKEGGWMERRGEREEKNVYRIYTYTYGGTT